MKPNLNLRLCSVLVSLFITFNSTETFASGLNLPMKPPPDPSFNIGQESQDYNEEINDEYTEDYSENLAESIEKKYSYVDKKRIVPTALLAKTLAFYDANLSKFRNKNYVVVIDYKQHNSKKRFYLINMQSGDIVRYLTAHGRNSDVDFDGFATEFSNISGSKMTSLGFFKTAETYVGENGYSLRLDGLSSTNSLARERAIVIHGASYVRQAPLIGRSHGCPALEEQYATDLIDTIKGGSLIYAAR